jgi:glycosyltransferase involved in cell wall biosynthesis
VRVCFVLNDIGLSGGTGVVVEHARQLTKRHGFDVTLAVTNNHVGVAGWAHRGLDDLNVRPLAEASTEPYDVAVATWWKTCYSLFGIRADRYAYFVQSLEDRFYEPPASDRVLAAATHALPVTFITEARWIAETLAELRPDANCFLVRNGVDKDVFSRPDPPEPRLTGPLRILLEGHPDVWFKGIGECRAVLQLMREPHYVTFVSPSGRDAEPPVEADRLIGPLPQSALAREYAEADVLLKMSRVEGMYGPPLEAFHMGATCVTTPVTGHDEYIEHGWNALVFDWDDPRGAARMLDLLARDRRFRHFLRTNAWLTARSWPAWQQSGDFMAAALRAVHRSPPPDPYAAASRMLHDALAGVSEERRERERATARAVVLKAELDHARQDVRNVIAESDRVRAELLTKGDELMAIIRSDAWTLGTQLAPYSRHPLFRLTRRIIRIVRHRILPRFRSGGS